MLVTPTGGKYWRLNYRFAGKSKMLPLGVCRAVTVKEARASLKEARAKRDEAMRRFWTDPKGAKQAALCSVA